MNEKEIAEILLKVNAVTLRPKEPFTFVSGIKSPIYCDNRLIISHTVERKIIIESFLKKIEGLKFDIVAGTATAGIPWAAWIALKLDKPMIYVRDKPKGHGKENQIEGRLEKGQKVLVVEDLISTGGSSVAAVEAVRNAGGDVIACVAIFTYGFKKSKSAFEQAKCKLFTLTNFDTLIDVAVKADYIDEEDRDNVLSWNKNPEQWGK